MGGRSGVSVPKNAQAIESDDAVDQRRLGETVRLLRQRAGFSIQDVAKRTGLSTGMISQLERALAMPSIRTLRLLSIGQSIFEECPDLEGCEASTERLSEPLAGARDSRFGLLLKVLSIRPNPDEHISDRRRHG